MTPLLPLGLAIVLNAAVLAGGTVWWRRQMKRVEVKRPNKYRDLFRLEPPPATGDKVQILVEDDAAGRTRSRAYRGRRSVGRMP